MSATTPPNDPWNDGDTIAEVDFESGRVEQRVDLKKLRIRYMAVRLQKQSGGAEGQAAESEEAPPPDDSGQ